jgi:hypothetical protein
MIVLDTDFTFGCCSTILPIWSLDKAPTDVVTLEFKSETVFGSSFFSSSFFGSSVFGSI